MFRDTVRVYPCGSVAEIAYELPARIEDGVTLEDFNASSPPGVNEIIAPSLSSVPTYEKHDIDINAGSRPPQWRTTFLAPASHIPGKQQRETR